MNYYRLGIAMSVFGFLVGIIFIAVAWEVTDNLLFAYAAKTTTGTLQAKHYEIQHNKQANSARFFFQYSYTADAPYVTTDDEVQNETYLQFNQNQPLPLRYLTSWPGTSRVDTSTEANFHTTNAWQGFGVMATIAIIGGAFFGWQMRRNRIVRALRTSGVPCVGKVKSLIVDRTSRGTYTSLEFTFTLPSGEVVTGQSDNLSRRQINWAEGDAIQVYYNPQNPDQFCVDLDQPVSKVS